MLKLLTSQQMREADAYTISSKGISSLNLMEAASLAFVKAFKTEVKDKDQAISIYCGTGNNGGDGLAIARLLKEDGYERLSVKIITFSKRSSDFSSNLERLKLTGISVTVYPESGEFLQEDSGVIVDAILGSGLNKPLHGWLGSLVDHLNKLKRRVISVDIPSGFPSEGIIDPSWTIFKAELAISFQRPKINFFFPESVTAMDRFEVVPIGLDEEYIERLPGYWKLCEEADIHKLIKPRQNFNHKGTFGHALIIAGSTETMGAALLCADACLHSGAGLTTACIPESGLTALNSYSPEVMALIRPEEWSEKQLNKYSSIALGPGLGTGVKSVELVRSILNSKTPNSILDADALNILSVNPELWDMLPELTILTPHVKEFDRMFGEHNSWWDRLEKAREKAQQHKVIILLKNQYTFLILPDGDVLINPTGNPAMATGGMGDVLTGMIAAFLAQGYPSADAATIACYIHGQAGDELKRVRGMFSIPPRYIIAMLPEMINRYTVSEKA